LTWYIVSVTNFIMVLQNRLTITSILLLAFAILLEFMPCPSFAAHPLGTEDATPVERDKWELEISSELSNSFAPENDFSTQAQIQSGLFKRTSLAFGFPYATAFGGERDSAGISNPYLFLKCLAMEQGEIAPALGLKAAYIFPASGVGEAHGLPASSLEFTLIGTRKMEPVVLHLNIRQLFENLEEKAGESAQFTHGSLAVEFRAFDRIAPVVEICGTFNDQESFGAGTAEWLLGAIYNISEEVSVDAGYRRVIEGTGTGQAFLAGLTVRF
jgi:hypothetical protein